MTEKELNSILKIDKTNEWALSRLEGVLRVQQKWEKAGEYLQKYQKITKKEDKHKLALYRIQEGRILINKKRFKDARSTFEDALNINGDLAVAYYFIGKIFTCIFINQPVFK